MTAARSSRLTPRRVGVAALISLATILVGIALGPASLPLRGVVLSLVDALPFVGVDSGLSPAHDAILWQLRLPRVILGFLVGGLLSMAGGAYQGVFRNPLADPYLLGVAAGAGLAATLAITSGLATPATLPVWAFVGALAGVSLTYVLGSSLGGVGSTGLLILAGVAVAAFLTAIQTYVQQQNAESLREVYSWILGRLTTVGWSEVNTLLPYAIVATVGLFLSRRLLDVLALGDAEAQALGIPVTGVRLAVLGLASLGTAAAVSVSGLIGFVGIIIPHAIRMTTGASYKVILPLSFLFGGAFLILADLLARTIAVPSEVPIGVITAFFGAPFFILILRRAREVGL